MLSTGRENWANITERHISSGGKFYVFIEISIEK